MKKEMKYTHDKNSVYAGQWEIARMYVGHDGQEIKVLQGTPRFEVLEKIIRDCPDFAKDNNINPNIKPYLFSDPKRKPKP